MGRRFNPILAGLLPVMMMLSTACQPATPLSQPTFTPGQQPQPGPGLVTSTPVPTILPDTPLPTATPLTETGRPSPGTIILDQTSTLNALQTSQVEYAFDALTFQTIRIDANLLEGTLNYRLWLIDKFGNQIAALESGIGQSVEAITEFTLPYDGTYRLQLLASDGAGTLQVVMTALDVPSGGGQLTGVGSSAEASISAQHVYHTYQFPLTQGEIIRLAAQSEVNGSPDTRLVLYGPDGRYLTEADDAVPLSNFDAILTGYVVPMSGTYTAIVTAYGRTTGSYRFVISSDTAPPTPVGPPDIAYNQVYTLQLVDGSPLNATFDGRIGDVLRITISNLSEDVAADLRLYSPYGQVIAFAVGADPGQDTLLREIQLPYEGRYRLNIQPIGSGTASLSITTLTTADLTGGGSFGEDVAGSRTGRFEAEAVFHYYQFNATFGDLVSISIVSTGDNGQLDLGFALIGPQGTQMVFADDSNNGESPDPQLLDYRITQTGTYTIIVYSLNSATGSYELRFTRQ